MEIKLKEVKYEGISYIAPNWEEMGIFCFEIAKKILESQKQYDRVVALAKGGWTWARTLVDYLQIDAIASIQIKFYTGVGKTSEMPVITQSLPISVQGEKVLLFDDVADSGRTIEVAREYLLKCGASSVDVATLFYKPRSIVKPEFYGYTTSSWVIFPHEIREIVEQAGRSWLKNKVGRKEILERFGSLSLPMEQIEYFLNKIK